MIDWWEVMGKATSEARQQAAAATLLHSLPRLKCLIFSQQANLAFDPTALLPGASPKSPGLKAGGSPFQSPPSTPSSPGVRSRASEPEEVPVSFDQPPEGSHLPCYNKVAPSVSGKHAQKVLDGFTLMSWGREGTCER